MQRALLAFVLLAFPAEFRKNYRAELLHDLEERSSEGGYGLRFFLEVLSSGIVMRGELVWRDVSYALRGLIATPLFSMVACGTLAVALAANAIIFGAVDAVLLHPLPYAHADRLFIAGVTDPHTGGVSNPMDPPAKFVTVAQGSQLVESAAAVTFAKASMDVDGSLADMSAATVTPNYFSVAGIRPYIGTFFTGPNPRGQVVISYDYWRTHYNGDASIVGRRVRLNDTAYTIVGVAPKGMVDPGFGSAVRDDVWTVFPRTPPPYGFTLIRTRAGVTTEQIRAELHRLWNTTKGQRWQTYPPGMTGLYALSVRGAILENAQSIWIFFAAAIVLLLVACANVMNLVLVRAFKRRDEFAIRASLGATARRIVAQSLTETFVLCALGCTVGLAIAAFCMQSALVLIPGKLPRLSDAHLNGDMILYTCALAAIAAVAAGAVPAIVASGKRIATRRMSRTGTTLVAVQVAAAFALLVCSGLLLRSLVLLTQQPIGFQPQNLYAAAFVPRNFTFASKAGPITSTPVLQHIQALPGVTSATLTFSVPFVPWFEFLSGFWRLDEPHTRHGTLASVNDVSSQYFAALRIPLLAGRTFKPGETTADRVIVVNESFAKKFFGTAPALNKQISTENNDYGAVRIVGIVADTRDSLNSAPKAMAYFPFKERAPVFVVVFRVQHADAHLAAEVTAMTRRSFPQFGVPQVTSLQSAVRDASAQARASFILLAALTAIVLLVALAGIYGVVSFAVARRYHEIGVRIALGAHRRRIVYGIVGYAIAESAIGVAAGLVIAAFAAQAIRSQLFKTAPFEPSSFLAAAALVVLCVAAASAVPAWRATGTDPARTLRFE
jgi:predicted permease